VVGHNSSDASIPAADIYQAGKLVMISPTSSSTKLTDRQDTTHGNYIYRTVISFNVIAETLTEYLKTSGKSKIVICSDSKATDQSFAQSFVNAMNNQDLQLINDINCDFAADNFDSEDIMKRAISKNADAILINPQVDRITPAIALAKTNQGKLLLLGNPSLQTKKILDAGKAVNGMVMAIPWHPNVSNNQYFVQQANEIWQDPNSITWRTATAFDATKVIANSIKQKGNRRINIQHALNSDFSYPGVTGTIQFFSWGDRKPMSKNPRNNAVLVQITPNPNTANNYIFVAK
jgi:branched-chain amino acid transport system substrate-binding protein